MAPDRQLWLLVIYAVTSIGLVWGIQNTRRVIEAPFLYAVGMLVIVCPQLYVVSVDTVRVPDEAYWVHNVMVVLCSAALYLGYFTARRPRKSHQAGRPSLILDEARCFNLGLVVAFIGLVADVRLRALGEISEWRGWPVYWLTLNKLIWPGVGLMVLAYYQEKKISRLVCSVVCSLGMFESVLFYGRRSVAIGLILVFAVPFVIYRRSYKLSRLAVVASVAALFVITYAFPIWRGRFASKDYAEVVRESPISEVIERHSPDSRESAAEVVDSMITIGAYYRLQKFDWMFIGLYNSLVESYVPGSLIGHDVKDGLRIGEGVSYGWVVEAYGIPVASYTAKNGYADAFGQLSFGGCLLLYFIGRGFKRASDAALLKRDGRAILFLCFFITYPAGIPYGSLIYGVTWEVPKIAVMWLAFRLCLKKSGELKDLERKGTNGLTGLPLEVRRRVLTEA